MVWRADGGSLPCTLGRTWRAMVLSDPIHKALTVIALGALVAFSADVGPGHAAGPSAQAPGQDAGETAVPVPVTIEDISRALERIGTLKARFTQVNADGSLSRGTLWIRRPGRARFEYDPPDELLVVIGGSRVAIFDDAAAADPTSYPLRQTPLWWVLGPEVDLEKAAEIRTFRSEGGVTLVQLTDREHPELGTLELVFEGNPPQLRRWSVIDEAGNRTAVILENTEQGMNLPASLFSVQLELDRRRERSGGR